MKKYIILILLCLHYNTQAAVHTSLNAGLSTFATLMLLYLTTQQQQTTPLKITQTSLITLIGIAAFGSKNIIKLFTNPHKNQHLGIPTSLAFIAAHMVVKIHSYCTQAQNAAQNNSKLFFTTSTLSALYIIQNILQHTHRMKRISHTIELSA